MKGYYQQDKGAIEVWLIREYGRTPIAYTDGEVIRLTKYYSDRDEKALEEFEDEYGLIIEA